MAGYRIKNTLDDEDEFLAVYKGYQVHVKRQIGPPEDIDADWDGEDEPPSDYWTGPRDGEAYYIIVRNSEIAFGTAYEGYWGKDANTLEEAVEEALVGSTLIEKSQRKFGGQP